ncbi:MAG TPA: metallophosphoesterase [Longimicrobium sp.]
MRSTLRTLLLLSVAALPACDDARPEAAALAPTDSVARDEDPRAIYGATSAENVRVTPVEIEVADLPAGWNGMKIAALSDFQLGLWPDNEKVATAAVRRALAEKPDIVVLLGDYVARGDDYAALDRILAPLRGTPVFAVLGHEDEDDDPDGKPDSTQIRTVEALQRNGVRVLRNARAPFGRNGDTAYIAGVEPFTPRRPEWRQAEIYGGIPGGPRTPLLLAHFPATGLSVPKDKYAAVLTGHTFCGRMEVPGTPRLTWVNTELYPGTPEPDKRRIFRVKGSTLFITCGVGYGFIPVRFGSPPEVAMVTLRGFNTKAAADSARAAAVPGEANVDSLLQVYGRRDTTATPTDTTGGVAP